jgi:hypothetical protein
MRPLPLEAGEALIRGQPTRVYDAGVLASAVPSSAGRWVTLKTAPRPVALAVDAVLGVRAVDEAKLAPLLPANAASAELTGELRQVLLEAKRVPVEALA